MRQALVIGHTGGIGSAVMHELLMQQWTVTGWCSDQLDLNYPDQVFAKDLSCYDALFNCAGHSQGTYLGFLANSWHNQQSQIMVNYVSNLALAKHYANSRDQGVYVWISTVLLDAARPFHSVYASTKAASKFALDLVAREAGHIRIVSVKLGPTKTNLRYRNFLGTRSVDEVNTMYDLEKSRNPTQVASIMINALGTDQTDLYIP